MPPNTPPESSQCGDEPQSPVLSAPDPTASKLAEVSPLASPPVPPATPRLSILHFLIWMALVAVCMTTNKLLEGENSNDQDGLQIALRVLWSVTNSLGIGGIILLLSRRFRRIPFLTQPGEWMLVIIGTDFVFRVALSPLARYAVDRSSYELITIYKFLDAGRFLCLGVLWGIAAGRMRGFGFWKTAFWIDASCSIFSSCTALPISLILYAIRSNYDFLIIAELILSVAKVAAFCVALSFDVRKRRTYTWTHWAGAIVTTLSQVVWTVFTVHQSLSLLHNFH